MAKSCFLTLRETLVVEKTQVFRCCEPGGEGEREKSSLVTWIHIITAEAKLATVTQTAPGKEGHRHSSGGE